MVEEAEGPAISQEKKTELKDLWERILKFQEEELEDDFFLETYLNKYPKLKDAAKTGHLLAVVQE